MASLRVSLADMHSPAMAAEVVTLAESKLNLSVPADNRGAIGWSLLGAACAAAGVYLALSGDPVKARNRRVRHAQRLAADLSKALPALRSDIEHALLSSRLSTGKNRHEILEQSRRGELQGKVDQLATGVAELASLLSRVPHLADDQYLIDALRHGIGMELSKAYRLLYGREPRQGRDWINLVQFAHHLAGQECSPDKARKLSPAAVKSHV